MRSLLPTLGCILLLGIGNPISFAQEREGERSAESEAGQRRSPEAEAERRLSPEARAEREQSAEAARGDRRESDRENAGNNPCGFRPRTPNEAALFQMIVQLQREVTKLRNEVQIMRRSGSRHEIQHRDGDERRDGDGARDIDALRERDMRREINLRSEGDARRDGDRRREGDVPREGDPPRESDVRRDGDAARDVTDRFTLPPRWQSTKEGKVFRAYDKNSDQVVSLDEWLAMTNGNINAKRRQLQSKRFYDAEPSGDGKFTPAEFIWWYTIGRRGEVEGSLRAVDRDESRK